MQKRNSDQPTRRAFFSSTAARAASFGVLAPALQARSEEGDVTAPATPPPAPREPDLATAVQWWDELPNKWTPIGWKDHLFRFNVLFNGTLIAQPDLNRRTEAWRGQGVQLTFVPAAADYYPAQDDGRVLQGWNAPESPVLYSEWADNGLLLRQEVFAHVLGGKEISAGTEPLFAWLRLSVHSIVEGVPSPAMCGFAIKLNAPHIARSMFTRNDLIYREDQAAYPRTLTPDAPGYAPDAGYRLQENGGKVRLGLPPGQRCSLVFKSKTSDQQDSNLQILLEARKGAYVDLLVPMLPTEKETFEVELALGYDRALQQTSQYWSQEPPTAAKIDTPEHFINQAIRRNLRSAQIIAERDPATGHRTLLSGAWTYADVWPTNTSMSLVWLLDAYGYHDAARQYLRVFKQTQGEITPPGDSFKPHPGYLASPKSLTSIDWVTDHGAILWSIANHALVTGDDDFIRDYTPVILKACDFIQTSRRIAGHGGVVGIMPPAVASDRGTRIQAVWSDGWSYKGLSTAVRLLQRIQHPRASEFAGEARRYKAAFAIAFRNKALEMPTWSDAGGTQHRLVPTALSGDSGDEIRHAFYLDTGPLFLVFAGLMGAGDELMQSALLWFREGPPTRVYRHDADCFQLASLFHETSSCEPCYSWNVYHSHQTGDRLRFLEGMYSIYAGAMSRQTFSICETRAGISGCTPWLPVFYMTRLAVIDDQIEPEALHLLRLMPLAWLSSERECKLASVPTEFGPISLTVRLSPRRDELQVTYATLFRSAPKRVLLHIPEVAGLKRITLNGKMLEWNKKQNTVPIS